MQRNRNAPRNPWALHGDADSDGDRDVSFSQGLINWARDKIIQDTQIMSARWPKFTPSILSSWEGGSKSKMRHFQLRLLSVCVCVWGEWRGKPFEMPEEITKNDAEICSAPWVDLQNDK